MPPTRKQHPANPRAADADSFDLGARLGRWQAFGFISGRCSVADVESLREIRNRKIYRCKCRTWSQFCTSYLGLGRAQIDRLIQHFDEFGPDYFHLTHIVRLSPQAYRGISHAVRDGAIRAGATPISLTFENAGRVRRAVLELSAKGEPPEPEDMRHRVARLTGHLATLIRSIAALPKQELDPKEIDDLIKAARRASKQLDEFQRSLREFRGFKLHVGEPAHVRFLS